MTGLSPAGGTCSATPISTLTADLTASLKRPGRKTLTLIDKALTLLLPFESYGKQAFRPVATTAELQELLKMISTHRLALCPYIDVDIIESNLRSLR